MLTRVKFRHYIVKFTLCVCEFQSQNYFEEMNENDIFLLSSITMNIQDF